MKYVLYRSLGNLDNQVKQHELVAVEYGSDIYEVTDALVRDVTDDLAEIPEYHGCVTTAYAPEPIHSFRKDFCRIWNCVLFLFQFPDSNWHIRRRGKYQNSFHNIYTGKISFIF